MISSDLSAPLRRSHVRVRRGARQVGPSEAAEHRRRGAIVHGARKRFRPSIAGYADELPQARRRHAGAKTRELSKIAGRRRPRYSLAADPRSRAAPPLRAARSLRHFAGRSTTLSPSSSRARRHSTRRYALLRPSTIRARCATEARDATLTELEQSLTPDVAWMTGREW